MQFAKSIMLKSFRIYIINFSLFFLSLVFTTVLSAQDNSPYSRYGLGDIFPQSNITTRGMGGISAGYADIISVNFNNPASYSQFFAQQEKNSKKLSSGRVILDAGVSFDTRTLIAPNTTQNFTASDALFSYLQVGIPLRKNWGLSFGLRPLSRISYKINRTERLINPTTGNYIDTAVTQFEGSGGSFLPTIGTGFAIKNFSAGVNFGYLFGRRETSSRRAILDTLRHFAADYTTSSSFGDVFFNGGIQYKIDLKKSSYIRLGLSGNIEHKLNATQDLLRQTYINGNAGEVLQIDSVSQQKDVAGEVVYPASLKFGFVAGSDTKGWSFGADYTQTKWSNYRFFGQKDSVQDSWQINVGGQFVPTRGSGYFSKLAYRFGAFTGRDYIKVQKELPLLGFSFGTALPIRTSRTALNQYSLVNLSLEYIKRGNNDNQLKENLFRISLGFNFTDLWFVKRKYD